MSRTYRTHLEWRTRAYGRDWTWEEEKAFIEENWPEARTWWIRLGWNGCYRLDRRARDRKPWDKPPRWLKAMNRRQERAKVRDAVNAGKDAPLFRKGDRYDWT